MVTGESKESLLRQALRPLSILIPLAIAGNFVYIIISSRSSFLHQLRNINISYLIAAFLMAFVPWLTHSIRIRLWAGVFNVKFGIANSLKVAIATELGSAITPTSTGGGYIKMALLAAFGFNAGRAATVTILGSLEDAVFFIIAVPLTAFLSSSFGNPNFRFSIENILEKWPWVAGLSGAILLVYIFIYIWGKKIRNTGNYSKKMSRFTNIISSLSKFKADALQAIKFVFANGKLIFLSCTILAGIGWISRYGAITLIAAAMRLPLDPILFFLLQWVVFTTMTAVPTPGAVGGAEASFAIAYGGLIPSNSMPLAIGLWRMVTFYLLVVVGGIILSILKLDFPEKEPKGSSEEIDK